MNSKQTVSDVLEYLKTHQGYIQVDNTYYKYKNIRKAIIDCMKQAMEDGYKKGKLDAEVAELFDVTIGGHKDW